MTTLYFAGAEQASHRKLLADCGVRRYAINLTNINRLVKGRWSVAKRLPTGAEWIAYADKDTTWAMAEPFVSQHPDLVLGPLEWAEHLDGVPFAPWCDEVEHGAYPIVGLTDEMVKNQGTLRSLLIRFPDTALVAVTGSNRGVERLDAVVSSAWIAAQRFGETQVWSGNKLHRYPNTRKEEVRAKYRSDIERLGIDFDRIAADDPEETARLAIVSWQAWESRNARPDVAEVIPLSSNEDYSDQDGMGSAHRSLAIAPSQSGHQRPREQRLLPVMALDATEHVSVDETGAERVETSYTVATPGDSFRHCDSCYLASRCPAYDPGHVCAFKIPVLARTKDEITAIMRAVIEIQVQRVMFARFAEEIDGQGVDGVLSAEIDRLFTILMKQKDIMDDSDTFRMTMEAKAQGGMLSRLFGSNVGINARALEVPVNPDDVLHTFDQ